MYAMMSEGLIYLQSQSIGSFFALFWFVILFEVPRYTLSFLAAAFFGASPKAYGEEPTPAQPVSVIIAGHNEEHAVESCIRSLWEQSLQPDEIIVVSDGSTDKMKRVLGELLNKRLIQGAYSTDLRAGKSAATNLAERHATGDILVNVDCDCSFDRHALKHIVRPFINPRIGAVSGNILVRNYADTIITSFQAIEYLISISLGKQANGLIDQVSCASGAFSAFRREALRRVGGLDAGGGEDLDVTLRLRQAGWKIDFSASAICYTDAPDTLTALINQRFRWERDAIRLRYRKHVDLMNPFSKQFNLWELLHQLEFLVFNILGALALPFYCLWLFITYGELAPVILIGAQICLGFMDVLYQRSLIRTHAPICACRGT